MISAGGACWDSTQCFKIAEFLNVTKLREHLFNQLERRLQDISECAQDFILRIDGVEYRTFSPHHARWGALDSKLLGGKFLADDTRMNSGPAARRPQSSHPRCTLLQAGSM